MKNFFTTSIRSIRQTGTISPSSRHLVSDMMNNIRFEGKQLFVEFGTGDGCITEALLSGMSEDSKLISFELNDDFYRFAKKKFAGDPRVLICNENALNIDSTDYLEEEEEVDYIVSSLPLTLLKQREVLTLLVKVKDRLKPGGRFIQYQYSLGKLNELKRAFQDVSLNYTILNIPPAFVYTCTKSED